MTKGESQVNSMYYVPPGALISLAALRKTLTWEISRPGFQCHLFWNKIPDFLNLFSYLYNEDNFWTLYLCGKQLVDTTWQIHMHMHTQNTVCVWGGGCAHVCFSVPINSRDAFEELRKSRNLGLGWLHRALSINWGSVLSWEKFRRVYREW